MDKAQEKIAELKREAEKSKENLRRKELAQSGSVAPPKKPRSQINREHEAIKSGVAPTVEGRIEEIARKVSESVSPEDLKPKGDYDRSAKAGDAALAFADALRAKKEEKEKQEDEDYIYYYECQNTKCLGPAFWIHEKPGGAFNNEKIEASYKPLGQPFMGNDYYCQCCLARGKKRKVPTLIYPHGRGPMPRLVRRMKREMYEQLMGLTKAEV